MYFATSFYNVCYYVSRYHPAVEKMKSMITDHGCPVMLCNARFLKAYSLSSNRMWWDSTTSGGAIVEEATHLCDLTRYLCGEVDLSTVQGHCVRESDSGGAGKLGLLNPSLEEGLSEERKVPRVHGAVWRFGGGGLGTLTHVCGLHGKKYETSIEVVLDGLHLQLTNHTHPTVYYW